MGSYTVQNTRASRYGNVLEAIRILQLVCCLGAATAAAGLLGGWAFLPVVALLLLFVIGFCWEKLAARIAVKSSTPTASSTAGHLLSSSESWETAVGSYAIVQDAVICIFFTLSAALLLTHALANRELSMLSSIAAAGTPSTVIVYGPTSSISSTWTAMVVMVVINAILFTISALMLAAMSVSGPSSSNGLHSFTATGTPYGVSTLVATV